MQSHCRSKVVKPRRMRNYTTCEYTWGILNAVRNAFRGNRERWKKDTSLPLKTYTTLHIVKIYKKCVDGSLNYVSWWLKKKNNYHRQQQIISRKVIDTEKSPTYYRTMICLKCGSGVQWVSSGSVGRQFQNRTFFREKNCVSFEFFGSPCFLDSLFGFVHIVAASHYVL